MVEKAHVQDGLPVINTCVRPCKPLMSYMSTSWSMLQGWVGRVPPGIKNSTIPGSQGQASSGADPKGGGGG